MYPVADSIGSLFVIHSYLRTSCNLHKSRHCCALLKAETTLHPRRHRKAFSCEYLSFFNGSTILICAGWEQERKKELTGINHYLKKCLTRYWQVTYHQRSSAVFVLLEPNLFLLPYNISSSPRGCFVIVQFNCLSSVSRDWSTLQPCAQQLQVWFCCPLWQWRWTSVGSGLIWVKQCTVSH